MGSETLPPACYILSDESSIPFYSTSNGYNKFENDPYTTTILFTSHVRPNFEYCSSVWSPQYQVHIDHIESVQKQFFLFALRGCLLTREDCY